MFKAGPNYTYLAPLASATTLTQWNGTFKDLHGLTVKYTMVGTNPATTNISSTTPVYIIPIKMVYGATNGNRTFDPKNHVLSNGRTAVNNTLSPPLFPTRFNFPPRRTNPG